MSSLPNGTLVDGRYEVLRLIAEGGMSVVYEVADNRLPGRLVLKQMRELVADAEAQRQVVEQFEREAATLAQLSHPNLPRVTDHFTWEGKRFLVEELVDGRTLEQCMEERAPRDEVEVSGWAVQICEALAYLHDRGIVYRDLKPSNVMLARDGGIRLIDFGIVRSFTLGKSRDTVVMGTPGFAAPEQYGLQQTDPRSDVFSLGALMHHLLTGHDPAATPFALPPARRLNPLLSERIEAVIARALAISADGRFGTALALRDAVLGHEPLRPGGETFRYPEQPPERGAHLAGAALLALVGALSLGSLSTAPGAAAAGIVFLPFWAWRLAHSWRRRARIGRVDIHVDDAGLRMESPERTVAARWDEVTEVAVRERILDRTSLLVVATARGEIAVPITGPAVLGEMLDEPPLKNADRLAELAFAHAPRQAAAVGARTRGA